MKKSGFKQTFLKRKNVLFSLLTLVFTTLIITYSCTKTEITSTENKPVAVTQPLHFEKQFIVYDESGNNSVTVRISANNETLLTDYAAEYYELIINPKIPEATPEDELLKDYEDTELFEFTEGIEIELATVQIDIINISFIENVTNYALVSHSPSMVDEDEEEMEEEELKAGLCRWFPRPSEGFSYYNVNAWGVNKVKLTFNRTKKTCNNIKYYVCEYNTYNYAASCHLKHPGDTKTYGPYYDWDGINLLWKQYKNQNPTYTFYYISQ